MTHLYHDIAPGTAEKLTAIIEIPKDSKVKYEVDKKTGMIAVDRILSCDEGYPENYGFVPQTHFDDGDPVDVIIVTDYSLASGTIVEVRPIGIMHMIDCGDKDDKIISVLTTDPAMKKIKTIEQLPKERIQKITHFFSTYKQKEGKKVIIEGMDDATSVPTMIKKSIEEYKKIRAET